MTTKFAQQPVLSGPGGADGYFTALDRLYARGEPTQDDLETLSASYGLRFS